MGSCVRECVVRTSSNSIRIVYLGSFSISCLRCGWKTVVAAAAAENHLPLPAAIVAIVCARKKDLLRRRVVLGAHVSHFNHLCNSIYKCMCASICLCRCVCVCVNVCVCALLYFLRCSNYALNVLSYCEFLRTVARTDKHLFRRRKKHSGISSDRLNIGLRVRNVAQWRII